MQRLLVVVNGSAGTADDEAVTAAVTALRRGADVEVATTDGPDELAAAVAGRRDRRLVVVGGDGSLHAAVRALDRAGELDPDEPVGIIARGTGNDFAGALGLPLDAAEGADVVLSGVPRPLDLVRDDDGGLVVNAVHAGIGALAGDEAGRFKAQLGAAAFPLGAAIAGVRAAAWHLRVEIDGRPAATGEWTADGDTGVLMVAVCNGPTIAGGTPLAPDAVPDDGLADVVVCTATGPVARAAFGAALLAGRHGERDDVLMTRGREIRIAGEAVELNADGELQPAVVARTWRVEPRAWSVLSPA